jgi:hypothetical protein
VHPDQPMAAAASAAGAAVVDVASLPAWSTSPVRIPVAVTNPLETAPAPLGPQRFAVDDGLNAKIYLW